MTQKHIVFSPVTRLSGLLSVEVVLDKCYISEANASSTMFRGFEWIMRGRHITDAVYMTQRVCGICSLAHGAAASYLLDDVYDNELTENAQLLRNIMYAADFLQNHIRHFYIFSLPDFVEMPDCPPFQGQNLVDGRFNSQDNSRIAGHYISAIKAAQESHQILALFGGKAPHQHSFVHGGVAVEPTVDKINQAIALLKNIQNFIMTKMIPDTNLIAKAYSDYFFIGLTPRRLLSFGLFKFGRKNERMVIQGGALDKTGICRPEANMIHEEISHSWFTTDAANQEIVPDPHKSGAYTWVKSVKYADKYYQVGPLARMIINNKYQGATSTMDRIVARSFEALYITELMAYWLNNLEPGKVPLKQNDRIIKSETISITDAMCGVLLHSIKIKDEQVDQYNIITPTAWNFSPKDAQGNRGPVESALVGTEIQNLNMVNTILGRIIRSFDPCIACATHVINCEGQDMSRFIL